jgi:hypothetical protein
MKRKLKKPQSHFRKKNNFADDQEFAQGKKLKIKKNSTKEKTDWRDLIMEEEEDLRLNDE